MSNEDNEQSAMVIRYIDNKHRYRILKDISCEDYKDESLLCGSDSEPSLFVSCGRSIDSGSDLMVEHRRGVRYCDGVRPTYEENLDRIFNRLRDLMSKNNLVLISDAVGVHQFHNKNETESRIRLGLHDTKAMWGWLVEHIDRFKRAGIDTLAMEFINSNPDLTPLDPDTIDESIISRNKNTNIQPSDYELIKSIASKVRVIGIDRNVHHGSKELIDSIERIQNMASDGNKIGVVVGSGYSREICRDSTRFKFPNVYFELINLNHHLEPQKNINLIALYCDDYEYD